MMKLSQQNHLRLQPPLPGGKLQGMLKIKEII